MKITDTVFHKLLESLGSGLYDSLINNGFSLVEINVRGAIASKYYAVRKDGVKNWDQAFGQLDAFDQKVNPWVQTVFGMKPITIGQTSSTKVFTNEGHMGTPHLSRTSANASNVKFGSSVVGFNRESIVSAFKSFVATSPNISAESMTTFYADIDSNEHTKAFADNVCNLLGYTRASNVSTPFYFIEYRDDNSEMYDRVQVWDKAFTDEWFTGTKADLPPQIYLRRGLKQVLASGLCGTKMLPIQITLPNKGDFSNHSITFGIPVVDDGHETLTGLIIRGDELRTRAYFDLRHTQDLSRINGQTLKQYALSFMGDSLFGTTKEQMTQLPERGWSFDSVYDGDYLLPVLCPPLDSVYGIVLSTSEAVEQYEDGNIVTVDVELSNFCTRISKEWYHKYYTTGFGLWKPRDSNIQRNMLEKWDNMEFSHLNFALVSTPRNFTVSGLIHSLPLYKDYSRAREKACKTNDFMSQPYSKLISWDGLAKKIERQPTRNFFISASHEVGADAGFSVDRAPFAAVTWNGVATALKDAYDYPVYEWTRVDSYGTTTHSETKEILDSIIDEVSGGANSNVAVDVLCIKAGYDYSAGSDLATEISNVSKNANVSRSASSLMYSTGGEYSMVDEYLSNSGYPVVDNMRSPSREMMVLRCYAELDVVGASLLRLINSFTSDVIIKRLLTK